MTHSQLDRLSSPGGSIELDKVALSYGTYPAISKISLDIPAGQFVSIVGPTGCGKSSVLNLIAGLTKPTSGRVSTDAQRVQGINRDCAYMFQSDALLPWRSAIDNVAFGRELNGIDRSTARTESTDWMRRVGLLGFEERYIHQLSGGQRKRVAIAQALINQRPILLMDEPFSALDVQTRVLMEQELLDIWSGLGATVVFVTHDLEEAIALSDRVILFTRGPEATIKGDYPVDLGRPRNIAEARFIEGFDSIYARVWEDLRDEVLATYGQTSNV